MRCVKILMVAMLALPMGCAGTGDRVVDVQPGPVTLTEQGRAGDSVIVIDNGLVKVAIEPAVGGRISSFIDHRNGFDSVMPQQGFLLDMFMRQNYPGEMQKSPYQHEVIDQSPERIGVKLWRKANGDGVRGIVVEKTVWVEYGKRIVSVDYRFANTGDGYRSMSYWTQHFAIAGASADGDVHYRPGAKAMSAVPYPGGKQYLDVVEEPGAGWTATVDPNDKAGVAFLFDYDYLRWIYNAFGAPTLEWFTDQVILAPGAEWKTTIRIVPLAAMGGLSFASDRILAHTEVQRGDDMLVLAHTLASPEGDLAEAAVTVRATPFDGKTYSSSIRISPAGAAPVTAAKALPPVAADRQVLAEVLLGKGGALGHYYVNVSDAEGKTDKITALRRRPPKIKQYPQRPADFAIQRDDKLDVLVLAGAGFARYNLKALQQLDPPANVRFSYYTSRVIMNARSDGVEYFPSGYDELAQFDAIVFVGMGPFVLEDFAKNMVKDFMEVGGRVLVLGGTVAMNGWAGEGNPLAETFPIVDPRPFTIRALPPKTPIEPADALLADLFADAVPSVKFAHDVDVAADAAVLLKTLQGPLLVQRKIGDGSTLVFLGTAMGDETDTPFWNWPNWPTLLDRVLRPQ